MNDSDEPNPRAHVDPIDREAATIDARSEDAPERIAELIEDAEALDRDMETAPMPGTEADEIDERTDQSAATVDDEAD